MLFADTTMPTCRRDMSHYCRRRYVDIIFATPARLLLLAACCLSRLPACPRLSVCSPCPPLSLRPRHYATPLPPWPTIRLHATVSHFHTVTTIISLRHLLVCLYAAIHMSLRHITIVAGDAIISSYAMPPRRIRATYFELTFTPAVTRHCYQSSRLPVIRPYHRLPCRHRHRSSSLATSPFSLSPDDVSSPYQERYAVTCPRYYHAADAAVTSDRHTCHYAIEIERAMMRRYAVLYYVCFTRLPSVDICDITPIYLFCRRGVML